MNELEFKFKCLVQFFLHGQTIYMDFRVAASLSLSPYHYFFTTFSSPLTFILVLVFPPFSCSLAPTFS